MNAVGWQGVQHIHGHANFDFTPLIKKAQEMPGFTEHDTDFSYPDVDAYVRTESFDVGYAHEVVLGAAETVIKVS